MSFGKMNVFIDILSTDSKKDAEGFAVSGDTVLATVRAHKEERHGSEKWANMAAFSEATALFRFRAIPSLAITAKLAIACDDGRYDIISVEDVKGRGMYVEVMAKRTEASESGQG